MGFVRAKRRETHKVAPNFPADHCSSLVPRVSFLQLGSYRKERPVGATYTPRTDYSVGGACLTTASAQIDHQGDIHVTSTGFAEDPIRRQA